MSWLFVVDMIWTLEASSSQMILLIDVQKCKGVFGVGPPVRVPGVILVGVPNLPKYRVPVLRSYRTYRSVQYMSKGGRCEEQSSRREVGILIA